MNKTFTLRTVLSITTGRLIAEQSESDSNGIGNVYEILNHMTSDNLFTHQLLRASEQCKPWLIQWFPETDEPNQLIERLDELLAEHDNPHQAILLWVQYARIKTPSLKSLYEIPQVPLDDQVHLDPVNELSEMTAKPIIIVNRDEG